MDEKCYLSVVDKLIEFIIMAFVSQGSKKN